VGSSAGAYFFAKPLFRLSRSIDSGQAKTPSNPRHQAIFNPTGKIVTMTKTVSKKQPKPQIWLDVQHYPDGSMSTVTLRAMSDDYKALGVIVNVLCKAKVDNVSFREGEVDN
jgi:hypothetical protein